MSVFNDLIHFGFFLLAMSRKKLYMAPMVSKKPHHGSTQHVVSHELSQHEWEMNDEHHLYTLFRITFVVFPCILVTVYY
jgi:hypothetical protein